MKQTPAHDTVNYDLLNLIPVTARRIVEVGCMHGQMAREYLPRNPTANYVGIDIDPDYAKVAEQFCTQAFSGDIESINSEKFSQLFPSDCWIFGDCLEHLRDPWSLLKNIRNSIVIESGSKALDSYLAYHMCIHLLSELIFTTIFKGKLLKRQL